MKFILILILLLSGLEGVGQVFVGETNINSLEKVKVVEVLVEGRFQSESVNVSVDYGQGGKGKTQRIVDPNNKKEMEFASTAELINYMENNKWELLNSQIITKGSNVMFYYYFRKKA